MVELSVELAETRYDRQERITWWDQDRLSRSRVLVVGAGALGNEVVKNLVLVGVGSVLVADFDRVELSNLARCVFFRAEDEGEPKSVVLANRARELNPECKVHALDGDARSLGTGIGYRADVVVGALDNREARLFLNRLAWRVGRPWVDGAIEGLFGVARVFNPPDSCYECTLTAADFEALAHRQSCRLLSRGDLLEGKVPTTASTSSVVAGVQAQEVVKLLHRDREGVHALAGGLMFDGANNDAYILRYPIDEECPAHDEYGSPVELMVSDATTVRDVARSAGFDEAIVELGDDHLLSWACPTCRTDEPARGVISLLTFDDARCPSCGEARQPRTTTAVEVPGELADSTLVDLALRSDEVLPVRRGREYRYVWTQPDEPDLPDEWR